jgi:hypothetical protein
MVIHCGKKAITPTKTSREAASGGAAAFLHFLEHEVFSPVQHPGVPSKDKDDDPKQMKHCRLLVARFGSQQQFQHHRLASICGRVPAAAGIVEPC